MSLRFPPGDNTVHWYSLKLSPQRSVDLIVKCTVCEHRQLQKLERTGKEFGITIVFCLLETLILYMKMKDQLHVNLKVFTKNREVENGKMVALPIYHLKWIRYTSHKIIGICMAFCNFCKAPIWTIFRWKLLNLAGWVAFHSVTFQLKCLDFQSNQFKKNSSQSSHVSAIIGYTRSKQGKHKVRV